MTWSAQQYVAFEDERTRPVRDLLTALPLSSARTVVDIGCGPGNSTALLAARFPDATVSALDSSPDMLAAARKRLPHVRFELIEIGEWSNPGSNPGPNPGPFDVILANAVLQWLPDHAALLPALVAKLTEGGILAVQVPDNLEEPAHRLMRDVAAQGPWAAKLAGAATSRTPRASAQWYYNLLRSCCAKVDVWCTTYYHPLAGGPAAIVEWFKGTGLRPFLQPLDETERKTYLERYAAALEQAYPALSDGTVLLPFPRLFMVATR